MKKIADQAARDTIAQDLDATLVVEAAAGTGKTTALVGRMVEVIAQGRADVGSLVAVTFTEKAAGELKLRLRAELEQKRRDADDDTRQRVETALGLLEEARVGTIHGFCADLLRERSIEARVDPEFEVLTEPESDRLFAETFRRWLQDQLEAPTEGIRRSLRRASGRDADGPIGRLQSAARTLASWRDFRAPWTRPDFPRENQIDGLIDQLHRFVAQRARCSAPERDYFYRDTAALQDLSDLVERQEAVRDRDHDGLEAQFVSLAQEWRYQDARSPGKGRGKWFGEGLERADIHDAHARFILALEHFSRNSDADLAALLQVELFGAVEQYEEQKHRRGRLDFVDLLLRTRDLVRDQTHVRAEFQDRFSHIFVDEFQDTDPLQAEILLLLAAQSPEGSDWRQVTPRPGKLFLVGDPKQAIYRFRRADVGTYLGVKKQLVAQGAQLLALTTSFRALPNLQRAINAAFSRVMVSDEDANQAGYVPLTPYRPDIDQPSVVALPIPRPYGMRNVSQAAMTESLPDAVGAYVEWLVNDSQWTVSGRERPDERVAIQPRHICLLFRRFEAWFQDVTRPYVDALEARGIRHLLVGGRSFHTREEVESVRTALRAIEWPDDELAVFSTLRGSLFAIGDEELLEYRMRVRHLHPFRRPESVDARLEPIVEALAILQDLHRLRNERPIADTVDALLESTRAHAAIALRPSGEQALANVLHLADQARAFEGEGGISFRGFVQRLEEEAQRSATGQAPILEDGSEGVRLMTVHRAKGLEFPIVILVDPTAKLARADASRTIDAARDLCAIRIGGWSPLELLQAREEEVARDAAEGVRIAYVAATRARELLVVPTVGDRRWGEGSLDDRMNPLGWLGMLNESVYPTHDQWAHPDPAEHCPEFGQDSVVARPQSAAFDAEWVTPGQYTVGDHRVVWWDPHTLNLGAPPEFGIRKQDVLSKDVDDAVVAADVERHVRWSQERLEARFAGSKMSLDVRTITEASQDPDHEQGAEQVEVVELPIAKGRPGGPRFGIFVHAVLAVVPLDANDEALDAVLELQQRVLGASADEVDAARVAVRAALDHDILKQAYQALTRGACRRETPLTLLQDGEVLLEGVADLAFRGEDGWTVLDFKTDRELPPLDAYREQVRLYARAVASATGEPARGVLMRV